MLAVALLTVPLAVGCGGEDPAVDPVTDAREGPTPGVIPTLPGGVDLGALDPTTVLVGAELTFGAPLPSEQAAAEAFTDDPEVSAALARRVFSAVDGRQLAQAVVLVLDGTQMFDESVLDAFVAGVVAGAGGADASVASLAGADVLRSQDPASGAVAIGFRHANLLTVVTSPAPADAELVVTRQLEARARGEVGSATPLTPLVQLPVEAALVPVPSVTFAAFLPPEEEASPEPPALLGTVAVEGRYGVVAGERRTVVWVLAVDRSTYPSAEALEPPMASLVAARAGGSAPAVAEVGGRVVLEAANESGAPSASAFRHGNLVLLVEGAQADQVAAVTTAWISALGGL